MAKIHVVCVAMATIVLKNDNCEKVVVKSKGISGSSMGDICHMSISGFCLKLSWKGT